MNKQQVINTGVSCGTRAQFIERVFELVQRKASAYVCFANVHMVIEAYHDAAFNQVLDRADVVTPDGNPVAKYLSFFYRRPQERLAGMDVLPVLLAEAERRGASVFFYGSTDAELALIEQKIRRELPGLRLAGVHSPPFRPLTAEEDAQVVAMINDAGTDLLFVSLGCPKQEKWMAAHQGRVRACMFGVGQAFRTYAGIEKRLPQWARDWSLEWVYRLYQEPGRLWKRYLTTNGLFLWLVARRLPKRLMGG